MTLWRILLFLELRELKDSYTTFLGGSIIKGVLFRNCSVLHFESVCTDLLMAKACSEIFLLIILHDNGFILSFISKFLYSTQLIIKISQVLYNIMNQKNSRI